MSGITKSDAQISGGETRQDDKDPVRFPGSLPRAPPNSCLRFTGAHSAFSLWPRLSHSTPDTQFREGSSLQAGLYARTPCSAPLTAAPHPVTIVLSPTRRTRKNAIGSTPLVTGVYKKVSKEVLK